MTLSVEHLHKQYQGRPVVRDVSFEVREAEIVALLGPNGAGKTTSFYSVVGVIPPDEGEIRLNNQRITPLSIHQRARAGLGYLPQETSVFRKLSVEDNIRLVLEFQPLSRKEQNARLDQLLEEFGIPHLRQKPAIQLSGGERRRVEIARAIASQPKFLLLDEPFTGIDPITIEELQGLIVGLTQKGIGVLITDHNPAATLSIVNRAYVMFDGQIIFHGSGQDVANSEAVREHYLGDRFVLVSSADAG